MLLMMIRNGLIAKSAWLDVTYTRKYFNIFSYLRTLNISSFTSCYPYLILHTFLTNIVWTFITKHLLLSTNFCGNVNVYYFVCARFKCELIKINIDFLDQLRSKNLRQMCTGKGSTLIPEGIEIQILSASHAAINMYLIR